MRSADFSSHLVYLGAALPAALVSLLLGIGSANAEIYTWKDERGRVHFSDKKPADKPAKQITIDIDNNTYSPVAVPDIEFSSGNTKKRPFSKTVRRGQVIMYSTAWCRYCGVAKDYFKRNGIPYTEYDIEKSGKAKREHTALGGRGVPLLLVGTANGTKKLHGFSAKGFEAVYKR